MEKNRRNLNDSRSGDELEETPERKPKAEFEFEKIEIKGEHSLNEFQSFTAFESTSGVMYLVTGNKEHELQLINLRTNNIESTFKYHSQNINCIKHYRRDGKDYLLSASNKIVIMVDFEQIHEISTDLGNLCNAELVFHDDTFSVVACNWIKCGAKVYDSQGNYINKFEIGQVRFINTYHDGNETLLIMSSAFNIEVFRLGTYDKPVKVFQDYQESSFCNAMVLDINGVPTLYACNNGLISENGSLFTWDFETTKLIKRKSSFIGYFSFLPWSEKYIITTNYNGKLSIWNKDLTITSANQLAAYENDKPCSIIGINYSSSNYFLTSSKSKMKINLWKRIE